MLRRAKGWLSRQLEQLRLDVTHFSRNEPIRCGSGRVAEIVPPIAGGRLRTTVSTPTMVGYLFIADAWHALLCRLLRADARLLDIGCGCGKMARNLLYHPYVKAYIGFDTNRDGIDFCRQHLVPRSEGRFAFHCLDVHSEVYNPQGTLRTGEVVFPAADGSVDLALAASLFTHLLEPDARHYLREVSRVLAPNGGFLVSLHSEPPGDREYAGNEQRIDVRLDYFVEMAREAGLRFEENLGTICGQDALLFKLAQGIGGPARSGGLRSADPPELIGSSEQSPDLQ